MGQGEHLASVLVYLVGAGKAMQVLEGAHSHPSSSSGREEKRPLLLRAGWVGIAAALVSHLEPTPE